MPKKEESKAEGMHLGENLKKLGEIAKWLEDQEQSEEPDFEAGLEKVKEAAKLIKTSREHLKNLENEFEEIVGEVAKEEEV